MVMNLQGCFLKRRYFAYFSVWTVVYVEFIGRLVFSELHIVRMVLGMLMNMTVFDMKYDNS